MLQCPRCNRQFPDDVHVCPDDLTPLQADATVADVPIDPLIGRTFEGKYRLDQRLGGGGMGTVYRATHLLIERPVAIKVLSQRFVGDETAQQRFRREARAAGRMHHPNAVTVTDFGTTDDGYLYIVMELLEGQTLRELLAHEAPLDPARAVSFTLQACLAVGAAHDAGLIHRDLKPPNIFIEQRPNIPSIVKVLDFGVAKFAVEEHEDEDFPTLTQVGAIVGTPRYMSPEQCSGAATLTPASDVYSLGILLYEMLTGAVPFSGDTPLAVALKQVSEQPRPPREIVPAIPEELEKLVLHALAKNPADRPANGNELRRELQAIADQLGLEHADSVIAPTMDDLRDAGNESPSGRLVIDIARLRQVQAATSADSIPRMTAAANAPSAKTTSANDTNPTANISHPDFNRVQVALGDQSLHSSSRKLVIVAAMVLIALLGGIALFGLANRLRNNAAPGTNGNQNSAVPSNANTNAATTSPTPSPTPSPSPSLGGRSENRRAKASPRPEKKSKIDSLVNKVKRIFKR
jgi:serine/threonine protein kinase